MSCGGTHLWDTLRRNVEDLVEHSSDLLGWVGRLQRSCIGDCCLAKGRSTIRNIDKQRSVAGAIAPEERWPFGEACCHELFRGSGNRWEGIEIGEEGATLLSSLMEMIMMNVCQTCYAIIELTIKENPSAKFSELSAGYTRNNDNGCY